MNTQDIKLKFHQLIDEIENKNLLYHFYEILSGLKNETKKTDFWDLFSEKQKKELEFAWEESEQDENLISHSEVKKESKQWLKK